MVYKLNPLLIPKFVKPLKEPDIFLPKITNDNNQIIYEYQVEACELYQQILPDDFLPTKVWGLGGMCIDSVTKEPEYIQSSPGPSFIVDRNIQAKIQWVNHIKGQYMFPVDAALLWANPRHLEASKEYTPYPFGDYQMQAPVSVVMNIHGGMVSPENDGHPDAWFTAGGIRGPVYNESIVSILNTQEPATLWYHDNTRGLSRLNLYSGLAGAYIIRDLEEMKINPRIEDIILMIQDKSFGEDASLYYPVTGENTSQHPYWVSEFYGDVILVNGISWPYMEIKKAFYRFRIINASNCRIYDIGLSDNSNFILIGTDGGYIQTPVIVNFCKLAPGERAEIIVDFRKYRKGEEIILKNNSSDAIPDLTDTIMQFQIVDTDDRNVILPYHLNTIHRLSPDAGGKIATINKISGALYINGQPSLNPAADFVRTGATYIWDFINLTDRDEAIHLHLIQFQILHRQPINKEEYLKEWNSINGLQVLKQPTNYLDPSSFVTGGAVSREEYERGWKDTVYLPPGFITRIIIRYAPVDVDEAAPGENRFPFDPATGGEYVMSSSMPEHSDNQALRPQFILR